MGKHVMARFVRSLGVVALFAGFVILSAVNLFTGADTAVRAYADDAVNISASPAATAVSFDGMMPGDSVTSSVVVSNTGDGELRYAITGVATNDDSKSLKDQLAMRVRTADFGTPCGSPDGAALYEGDLDGDTGAIVGSVAAGPQAGDRTLGANGSETLCFTVTLPLQSGNEFQGAGTVATFTFVAEQTAGN